MEPLGSLSPGLLQKLNKKHRFVDDERKLVTPRRSFMMQPSVTNRTSNKSNRNENSPESIQGLPPSYVEFSTVRDLLEKMPCNEKIEVNAKDRLEFMSYLRPVLKEEMYEQDGGGWDFLAKHVHSNREMFQKILQQRLQEKAMIEEAKFRNNYIAKQLTIRLKKKVQEEL